MPVAYCLKPILLPRLLFVPPITRRIWLALEDMQRILKASADLRFSAAAAIPVAVEQPVGASRECKSIVLQPALLAALPVAALALAVARNLHLVTFPRPHMDQANAMQRVYRLVPVGRREGLALADQVR